MDNVREQLSLIQKLSQKAETEENLKSIISLRHQLYPVFKMYEKHPMVESELKKYQQRLDYIYEEATTKLLIKDFLKESKLEGIIFLKKKKNKYLSRAFINGKCLRVNDELASGMKVKNIENKKVIFEYKGKEIILHLLK